MEQILEALLPDPDRVLSQGMLLKDGHKTRAARIEIEGDSYFMKGYPCGALLNRCKNAFRCSRAVRSWHMGREWIQWGFPVPRPVVCLEERRSGMLIRSYIVTEFIRNGRRLKDIWPDLSLSRKHLVLERLAEVIGGIHRRGGMHGDLKWNNILVGSGRDLPIVLCDNDASRLWGHSRLKEGRKDLKRFLRDLDAQKGNGTPDFRGFFLRSWERYATNEKAGR
jgi:tRNA A-37 threonylcarbamoyl transferase component Bud32